jgi:hypothetical protein
MPHAGQSDFATIHANAILDFEVPRLHADTHTKTMNCEHTAFADWGFARRDYLL